MRSVSVLLCSCALACAHSSTSDPAAEASAAAEVPTLPATLTGTMVATDDSRRVLVLMDNLIATMAEEVTEPPEYDLIAEVQCDEPFSCRVTANGCEGTITRNPDTSVVVAFVPVGTAATDGQACKSYSGRYAVVDDPLLPEAPNRPQLTRMPEHSAASRDTARSQEASEPTPGLPQGRVVVGNPSTSGSVDVGAARRVITGQTERLEKCYTRYLLTRDGGGGIMRFALDHGAATRFHPRPVLEESTLEDDALEACVMGVIHDSDRLIPSDGRRARVHYVLSFVGR